MPGRVGDESTMMSAKVGTTLALTPEGMVGKPFEKLAQQEEPLVKRSCMVFDIDSSFRKKVLMIIKHTYFDRFITFLILANCGFLMVDSPVELVDEDNMTGRQYATWLAEYIFLGFFTLEMILKIIGLGFIQGKGTYLKNGWNWLDFIVVIIGYLGFIGLSNLSALRTFRVLRPLRTLTTVPGMKVIVVSMIASLPALSGVLALSIGMFFVWSVIGIQLWGGVLEARCYYPPTRSYKIPLLKCTGVLDSSATCKEAVPQSWGCSPVLTTDTFTPSDGGSPLKMSEPVAVTSFALDKMTGLPDVAAVAGKDACRIPCASANCGNYTMGGAKVEIIQNPNQTSWKYGGELILNPDLWPLPRNASHPETEKERHGVDISATLKALKLTKNGTQDLWGTEPGKEVELVLYPNVTIVGGWDPEALCGLGPNSNGASCESVQNGSLTVEGVCKRFWSPAFGHGSFDDIWLAFLVIFTSVTLEGWVDNMYRLNATFGGQWFTALYFVLLVLFGSFFVMNLAMAVIWDEYAAADEARQAKEAADAADEKEARKQAKKKAKEDAAAGIDVKQNPEPMGGSDSQEYCMDTLTVRFFHRVVSSKAFDAFITVFIVLNTITLAMEFYDMSDGLKLALEICNYIFSTVFLLEMVMKLWGLGPRKYAADAFNVFDGVIVTFSVIEIGIALVAKSTGEEAGSTGLGALRTFRLMRVFKLARSWKDLRPLVLSHVRVYLTRARASKLELAATSSFSLP